MDELLSEVSHEFLTKLLLLIDRPYKLFDLIEWIFSKRYEKYFKEIYAFDSDLI